MSINLMREQGRWLLLSVATLVLCLGSPNRLLHWYPAALVGLALAWGCCWAQPWGVQVRRCFFIWFVFCLFVFLPDLFSIKVLQWWEYLGGIVVAPLLPLFYMFATILSLRWSEKLPNWLRPLAMATIWTGLDGILGLIWFPIPFHWGSLLFDWPLGIQIADITGIWGVTWLAVLVNAALICALRGSGRALWLPAGLAALVLGYGAMQLGHYQQDPERVVRVGGVQQLAWLEADRSWPYREARYRELHQLSEQAVAEGARLVVWSEGALRARLVGTPLEPYILNPMRAILPSGGALITGATEPDPDTVALPEEQMKFWNMALLYDNQGVLLDRYGKQWLFPYFETGRYVPSPDGYRPLQAGPLGQLGLMICLESVLPAPSRALVRNGAQVLITISDNIWFGNSNWPMLHGNLSIFRAVENRRSFLFVNNTGGNLIVDPSGQVQKSGQIFVQDVIVGDLHLRDQTTLYTKFGDWFVYLTVSLTIALAVRHRAQG